MHAQLRLVVARGVLSAKEFTKIWRALGWTVVSVSNVRMNVEGLAIATGEDHEQFKTRSPSANGGELRTRRSVARAFGEDRS